MKDKRIVVPVDVKEHAAIKAHASEKGFDSVASYIRWLVRLDMENKK